MALSSAINSHAFARHDATALVRRPSIVLFSIGMLGLGFLAFSVGDFALSWQPVASWFPARTALAYLSGLIMVIGGLGLLFHRTITFAVRLLFPYLIVWALLKVPALFVAPQMEAVWLGIGEITGLLSGGWILFARFSGLEDTPYLRVLSGEQGVRLARLLFAVSLLPIGLSHLVYAKITAGLVPSWLPYRPGWAMLTGLGQMASGLGVLFGILPRIAAYSEAVMISLFTLLIWLPATIAAPATRMPWTAFWISWAIASAAWVVAEDLRNTSPPRKLSD